MNTKITSTILLVFLLFKADAILAQTSKKGPETCGKTMSTIFKKNPKSDPVLTYSVVKDDEYCDTGRYELNANYLISFYNAENKLIYDKHVFLNEHTFVEETSSKGKFTKAQILPSQNSRIVKIPITKEMGEAQTYKIQSLATNKTYKVQKINGSK